LTLTVSAAICNLSLPAGVNLIANRLNYAGGNMLNNILPNPPPGTTFYKWDCASWTNWVLQERLSLNSGSWSNAPSGTNNPATVPATLPTKFYRLFKS